jgi:hypothetical protein
MYLKVHLQISEKKPVIRRKLLLRIFIFYLQLVIMYIQFGFHDGYYTLFQ